MTVKYQSNDRIEIYDEIINLAFLASSGITFDIEKLINDVLADAGLMKSFSEKKMQFTLFSTRNFVTFSV